VPNVNQNLVKNVKSKI